MIDPAVFLALLQDLGVSFFAGVPDSLLQPFIGQLLKTVPSDRHVIAANEGAAIGLAAGYHLATGAVGCVYMQNSGLGNAINPLTSLMDAEVYGLPAVMVIGWRGEMMNGKQVRDEPQHTKQGRITLGLLDCLDIPHTVLCAGTEHVSDVVGGLVAQTRRQSRPVALVVRSGTFSGAAANTPESSYPLSREDALKIIMAVLPNEAVVVSTTGKASRELYEMRLAAGCNPDRDFLTVGSMGHALQIASGIALARPDRRIVCIDGDGAVIMHMGGMTTSAGLPNLLHIVLNNGAHDSTGGQPTRGFAIDMPAIARACGYGAAARATDRAGIRDAVETALRSRGSAFIEMRTRAGSRTDLTRPKTTPGDAKWDFMRTFCAAD